MPKKPLLRFHRRSETKNPLTEKNRAEDAILDRVEKVEGSLLEGKQSCIPLKFQTPDRSTGHRRAETTKLEKEGIIRMTATDFG
jgi:hypothetical protein